MGSVPVQLLVVANFATNTTCDTMGDTSNAMTCENRASKHEKTHTHTYIKSKPLGHMQARYMHKESASMRSSSELQQWILQV